MTSIKAAAAIAAVLIVVCAAGAYVVLSDNGSDSPTREAIGSSVSIGDSYTLESIGPSGTASVTEYKVTAVEGDTVTVDMTSDGVTTTKTDSVSGFLDDVSVSTPVGMYQRTETISANGGQVVCDVYFSEVAAGNATTVATYDWIGQGTNIVYQTEISIKSDMTTEVYRTTLKSTNMIGSGSGVEIPTAPSVNDDVRTELVKGDYIEYTEFEGYDREDVERFTVLSVEGDMIVYTDDDDRDWDDAEMMPASYFLRLLVYSGSEQPVHSESIDTRFGTVQCDVYQPDRYPGFDWDERITFYVGQDNNVIYRFVINEWDDDRDDREVYELTGTSLFLDAPTQGGGSGNVTPSDNRYGVTLAVGDYYVINDDDDRELETREIIAIENGRLIVKETEGREVEVERMSANDFLDDIMVTQTQLDRMTSDGSESVNGVQCSKYTFRDDDDRVTIWVGPDNVVWKAQEMDDWNDVRVLMELGIASLA